MFSLKSSSLFAIQVVMLVITFPLCVKADESFELLFDNRCDGNKSVTVTPDDPDNFKYLISPIGQSPIAAKAKQKIKGPVSDDFIFSLNAGGTKGLPAFKFQLQDGNSYVEQQATEGDSLITSTQFWFIPENPKNDANNQPIPFDQCPTKTQCGVGSLADCSGTNPNFCNVTSKLGGFYACICC